MNLPYIKHYVVRMHFPNNLSFLVVITHEEYYRCKAAMKFEVEWSGYVNNIADAYKKHAEFLNDINN
jgi:hypothetical protein